MNLVIFDPNLAHPHGHHMEWDLAIAKAAKDRGQNVIIFANRECTIPSRDGVEVVPWFTHTSYASQSDDKVTGHFDDFRFYNDCLAAELNLIPRERFTANDLVIVPTLTEINALGYVAWAKTLDPMNAPLVVLYLMFPSGVALEGERSFSVIEPLRALFYRLAYRMAAEEGTPVYFFGGGRQLAREFSALFETEVKPHPIPVTPMRRLDRPRSEGQSTALLFAGDAKVDKGFALVPALADQLAQSYPGWTFVIHANAGAAWGQALESYEELLRVSDRHSNIRLRTGRLTREDYMSLLATSDCLVSTYDPVVYARKSSGVLWEAVSLGMVAVVPAGTWLENEAKEWGAGYKAYAEYSVAGICETFASVAEGMSALLSLSREASRRYHAFNGVDKVLNQLGTLWVPRIMAASMAKQPSAHTLSVADMDLRGWHGAEGVGETAVRWTDKEFITRFKWPFRSAWELEFSVMNFVAADQLRDAKAFVGGSEVSSTPILGEHGDSRLIVSADGPGRTQPTVELVVRLPWTFRPEHEARDLGLLVSGIAVKPAQAIGAEAGSLARPLEILSPATFNPAGTAFSLDGAVSGIAMIDPGNPVVMSFVVHSSRGAEVSRAVRVFVNGVQAQLDVHALAADRWKVAAHVVPHVLMLRGLQLEWDLVLDNAGQDPVWIAELTFDNETMASPNLVRHEVEVLDEVGAALDEHDMEERQPDAMSANAKSFSKMLEEQAAVRGSLSNDRSGYVEAGVGTAVASAEALQLDGYFAGSADWSHLEISLFLVSLQGENWGQVKFKFCIEQGRPLLEFRRIAGWPDVFETWFGTGEDQFSPYVHVTADDLFTDLRLTRRDLVMLQAIATLLPNVVERAISLPEWRIANAAEWVKIAKIASRDWLRKIAAQHGAAQPGLVARE